jgi:hypothetical protein
VNAVGDAIRVLVTNGIILVIDDFHYIDKDTRVTLMRNVKGPVFNGLKVVLLSVTHRAFDAIKAESELTGRFTSVTLPVWEVPDLRQIPVLGFAALRVSYSDDFLGELAREAQGSPFLMQKFCWEICFDCDIEKTALLRRHQIPDDYPVADMFVRIAQDAGLPIYQRLVAGPQSRKARTKRPLLTGEEADIYEATLLALAETGPKPSISYEELRTSLNNLLVEMMPQKHEITSALKHLANISMQAGTEDAIDWDEDKREINVADPYLRFYLRWQVRNRSGAT